MPKKDIPIWARTDIVFDGTENIWQKAPPQSGKQKDERFVDDGTQETFSVKEIASLLNLSSDTVRRMFADEQGVITLGNENPRGKRRRVTLRIPRNVYERVKRQRAKK
jgi:AraC-like DNA-binding protein